MKRSILGCIVALGLVAIIIGLARSSPRDGAYETRANQTAANKAAPLFVVIEYNPWLMVIGSDSPTFALYDDGTLIYWRTEGRTGKYLTTHLKSEEVASFLDGVNRKAFESLGDHYLPAVGISDQPEYLLVLKRNDGTYKSVSVYGRIEPAETRVKSAALPEALVAAFHHVNGYHNPQAHEWLPDFIEVMIWPYEYAPDKNLDWPKDWPGLQDLRTVKRGDSYSLFVEKSRLSDLRTFLAKRRERQAVQIAGR